MSGDFIIDMGEEYLRRHPELTEEEDDISVAWEEAMRVITEPETEEEMEESNEIERYLKQMATCAYLATRNKNIGG